jgi:NAD-dependent SIR2 family protein deacetylase
MVALALSTVKCKKCKQSFQSNGCLPAVLLDHLRLLPLTCPKCDKALWKHIKLFFKK